MQRITISLEDGLAQSLDDMVARRGYGSRSEAMRDLVRDSLERWRSELSDERPCVASLTYIYDRRVGSLTRRLAEMQHAAHDLVVSTLSVRLDHFSTLETITLRAEAGVIQHFANRIRSERGVRLASLNVVEVEPGDTHESEHDHHHHGNRHLTPLM